MSMAIRRASICIKYLMWRSSSFNVFGVSIHWVRDTTRVVAMCRSGSLFSHFCLLESNVWEEPLVIAMITVWDP